MCPLENQDSFFVPELLEKQTEGEEEPEDEKAADDTHTGMTLSCHRTCLRQICHHNVVYIHIGYDFMVK